MRYRVFLSLMFLWLEACSALPFAGTPTPMPTPTLAPALVVYADRALTNPLLDIRTAFEQAQPATIVEFTFSEPGEMSARLESSLRPEIIMTSDAAAIDLLRRQDRLNQEPHKFVNDPLAVIIARTNPAGIERIQDLNRSFMHVALAPASTSLGQASRTLVQALSQKQGFGPNFPTRFYHNITVAPSSEDEILDRINGHQAYVGIVHASEAELEPERVLVLDLPQGINVATDYFYAVLNSTHDPARAQPFVNFLTSPAAQQILTASGFVPTN